MLLAAALFVGAVASLTTAANAAGGCGYGFHPTPYGRCPIAAQWSSCRRWLSNVPSWSYRAAGYAPTASSGVMDAAARS